MVYTLSSQEIWVNVEEGAKITGYHSDYVRRLARENWRVPEAERFIRVRRDDGHAYTIWLPDLMNYAENHGNPISVPDEEIWVNVTESAKTTGYSRGYIVKLAMTMQEKAEQEREIRVRKRSNGYELWLSDLLAYRKQRGYGPQRKRNLAT